MKKTLFLHIINHIFCGCRWWKAKRFCLRCCGFKIGKNVRVVGPIYCTGHLSIGNNTYIGPFFKITGNGFVTLGENIDIAPEVTIGTGSHKVGEPTHRAGEGLTSDVTIGNGCWICQQATIVAGERVIISDGIVIGARSLVLKSLLAPGLYVGIPAKFKKAYK